MNREKNNKMWRNYRKEIEEIVRQEKKKYEKKRANFYNNPLHWDNNKRKRYGLPVLRGKVNRYRTKCYPSFKPSPYLFYTVENIIEKTIVSKLSNTKFVDVKNVNIGDKNVFYYK